MAIAKRIVFFVLVNILVVTTISIILGFLGIGRGVSVNGINYEELLVYCLVWGMTGSFISLAISRMMAKWMMGVKVIDPNTRDPGAHALVQTVHELARKAGIKKMPEVGIYDSPEVNAFATGPTKNRSLVAVSTGLLNRMDQASVEGVLGHEIAHIANGDMVTMTLLQGIVNAFAMFIARIVAFFISQQVKEEARHMTYFAVSIVCEILLMFLGMIVIAAFSRWREFRADRGGAQLAGREKMITALRSLQKTTGLIDAEQGSVASLKIASKPSRFFALFSTHPPLENRIRALERASIV